MLLFEEIYLKVNLSFLDCEPGQLTSKSIQTRVLCSTGACCFGPVRQRCVLPQNRIITPSQHHIVDVSVEQVAALSSQNELPVPSLDLDSLPPSNSTFVPAGPTRNFSETSTNTIQAPVPQYSSDDPWNTNTRVVNGPSN